MQSLLIMAASNTSAVLETVAGLVSLVIIAAIVITIISYQLKSKKGVEALSKFLSDISNAVLRDIIDQVANLDPDFFRDKNSLAQAEGELISKLYDSVYDICCREADSLVTTSADIMTVKLIKNALSRENIESFAHQIIYSGAVQDLIEQKMNPVVEEKVDEAEELEKEYEKFNDEIENGQSEETVEEMTAEEASKKLFGDDPQPIIPPTFDDFDNEDEADDN